MYDAERPLHKVTVIHVNIFKIMDSWLLKSLRNKQNFCHLEAVVNFKIKYLVINLSLATKMLISV